MKLNLLAGAAVAAVVAASAPLAANAQTTGTDWTGFYAGINLGGAANAKLTRLNKNSAIAATAFRPTWRARSNTRRGRLRWAVT